MKTALYACALLLVTHQTASAQYSVPVWSPPTIYHHASTYDKGVQRGLADLIRSVGENHLNTSLTLLNREQVISRRIRNQQLYVRTHFESRQANRTARFQNQQRQSSTDLARREKEKLPAELGATQYQPLLSKLVWPRILRGELYAAARNAIDAALKTRSVHNSGLGSDGCRQVVA